MGQLLWNIKTIIRSNIFTEFTSFLAKFEQYPSKNLRRLFQNHYLGEHGPSIFQDVTRPFKSKAINLRIDWRYNLPDISRLDGKNPWVFSVVPYKFHPLTQKCYEHLPWSPAVKPPGTFSASNVGRWPWHGMQRLDPTLHMDERFLYVDVNDVQIMKHAVYALLWAYHSSLKHGNHLSLMNPYELSAFAMAWSMPLRFPCNWTLSVTDPYVAGRLRTSRWSNHVKTNNRLSPLPFHFKGKNHPQNN